MLYYIQLDNGRIQTFDTVPHVIRYLEMLVEKKFRKTRYYFMSDRADLGHGSDSDASFYECMTPYFSMGVVRKNGPLRCNIFTADNSNKDYGD